MGHQGLDDGVVHHVQLTPKQIRRKDLNDFSIIGLWRAQKNVTSNKKRDEVVLALQKCAFILAQVLSDMGFLFQEKRS